MTTSLALFTFSAGFLIRAILLCWFALALDKLCWFCWLFAFCLSYSWCWSRTPGGRPLSIHSWLSPSSGVNLLRGSHSRQRLIMSTKRGSGTSRSFSIMYLSLFSFSRSEITSRGAGTAVFSFLNCLKSCFLVDRLNTLALGMPITSIMSWIYSRSLVPGKSGNPVKSSIMMQPNDHMSICCVYGNTPSMMSGAR